MILGIVLTVMIYHAYQFRTLQPTYQGITRVQMTAPPQDEVSMIDRYRASNLRDEIMIARNNFATVLRSREVFERTIAGLRLTGAATSYEADVQPIRDTDFVDIVVTTTVDGLAEKISGAHVVTAVAYYGELRARPAIAMKNVLSERLNQLSSRIIEADANVNNKNRPAGAGPGTIADDPKQLRDDYQATLKKYGEAALVVDNVRGAGFIQIVETSNRSGQASELRRFLLQAVGATFGSMVLAVLLAVALDALTRRTRACQEPVPPATDTWRAPSTPSSVTSAPQMDRVLFERASAPLAWPNQPRGR